MQVTPTIQTITRVTKQKNPHKVWAEKLSAKICTHNLQQKLLNDLNGKRFEVTPIKNVESTPVESTNDWTMVGIAAAAGIIALIAILKPPSEHEPAKLKQVITPQVPLVPTIDQFYMQ